MQVKDIEKIKKTLELSSPRGPLVAIVGLMFKI